MTRREKRQRFSNWLASLLGPSTTGRTPGAKASDRSGDGRNRRILVEPLETRQLLAADGFEGLLGSSYSDAASSPAAGGLVGEGEMAAEGEAAVDLVALAQAITDSGTRFFGAAWCPFCTDQKELFQDGYKFLPFLEVTNPDRTPNQLAIDEGITEYPTWEFPDGSRLTGVQTIETLAQRAGVNIPMSSTPSFDTIQDVNVEFGSPLHIPVDAYDPNGNPLTITVESSNSSVISAEVITGNRSLRLNTAGYGDMVFELFETRAPRPTGRVIELAQDGFYDGIGFHRVIDNFVLQGGDPTGSGAGGSTLGDFDDQYHVDLQHNRTGVLSYAKTTDDTNDSQFFITENQQRHLDFNHSIFGQLIEGEQVREAISETQTGNGDRPTNNIVIEDATVFTDTENGLIMLRALGTSGSSTITVTVSDNEGNETSQTFVATAVADTSNGAPFFDDIPAQQTTVNTPVSFTLGTQDAEGDTGLYSVQPIGQNYGLSVDSSGQVTVTPPTDFVGELQFLATVAQSSAQNSPDDNQIVTVQVVQPVPTGIDLAAATDTGISDSDNITSATSISLLVAGTTNGSTVEIRSGGNVVGSAVASGTTTEVVVDVSSLGEGSTAFTATQTTGGQTSNESPALNIVLDRTGPATIGSGVIPTSIVVGQTLSVDISHGEEGQGLSYGLTSGPTGLTLGNSDGVVSWVPATGQTGIQTISLALTDAAGNVTNQDININVIEPPDVRLLLRVVDSQGQPLSTVAAGETFRVQVTVEDLRTGGAGSGVFGAYVDLLYDSNIIEPVATDPISHIDPYGNGVSGSVATLGLVDELGAFSTSTAQIGNDLRVLAEVTFQAKTAGNAGLLLEAADDNGNDILLYDQTEAVPLNKVQFGSSDFAVGANFELIDDQFDVDEDSPERTYNLIANDNTTGGATLSIVELGATSNGGTVAIAAGVGQINYTPSANFSGAETFTYTAQNQDGVRSTATVTMNVAEINDPPAPQNDTFSVFENSSNNLLDVLLNDTTGVDPASAESLTVTAVSAGSAGGTLTITGGGLGINYTPASNFQGTETFTYTVSDGRGGSETATASVSVAQENPPPTPQNDSFTVTEDAAQASFDVLANDTTNDPSETLSVSGVSTSANGSTFAIGDGGQSVLYTPAPNFAGSEVLTYTLRDSGGATATGTVTFTVENVNDAPDAVDDTFDVVAINGSSTLNVLLNDTDVDTSDTLTIDSIGTLNSGEGTVAIASDGRSVIYTPPSEDFEGTVNLTYTVRDADGLTDQATAAITIRDFVPRTISGSLRDTTGLQTLAYSGLTLRLTGTDITGAQVSNEVPLDSSGNYEFPNLAPGSYTLTRDALPFLHDSGQSFQIESAVGDGDAQMDLQLGGSLRAEYFDIRDFLGSSFGDSLIVALNGDGTQNWVSPRGEWENLSSINTTYDATTDRLQINAVDQSQASLTTSLAVLSSTSVAHQAGQESAFRLLRVRGTPTGANLAASAGASGEGEGVPVDSGLVAEGEGIPAFETPNALSGQPADDSDERSNQSSGEPWTPAAALRRVLGSQQSQSPLTTAAVDSAMESVLPALELQLSDNLQDALTADESDENSASDAALTDL